MRALIDRALGALCILLPLAACQSRMSDSMGLSEADVAAIRTVHDQLVANERAGNWDAVIALFTPDVMLFHANTPPWKGGAAVKAAVDAMQLKIVQLHATPAIIEGRGDLAYLRGTYHESFTVGGGTTEIEDSGNYVWILRKQADGRWLVAEGVAVSDRPLPAAAGGR
ncbi:MAG TPA: nuclear transport factor 2 family protein [Gemmatimonadales bacterium]